MAEQILSEPGQSAPRDQSPKKEPRAPEPDRRARREPGPAEIRPTPLFTDWAAI